MEAIARHETVNLLEKERGLFRSSLQKLEIFQYIKTGKVGHLLRNFYITAEKQCFASGTVSSGAVSIC
jgi:hypothetical protein